MKGTVVGFVEKVIIHTKDSDRTFNARIDSGAKSNSIDMVLAKKIGILPGSKTTVVKNANGQTVRPVVNIVVTVAGRKIKGRFTLASRAHLKYQVLIGRDILKKHFIVDSSK